MRAGGFLEGGGEVVGVKAEGAGLALVENAAAGGDEEEAIEQLGLAL